MWKRILISVLLYATQYHFTFAENFQRTALYIELGGQGIGLSANVDYRFTPHCTARFGVTTALLASGVVAAAHYISGIHSAHHFEAGFGLNVMEAANFFGGNSISVLFPCLILGYRYQPPDGGVVFRISFTPFFTIHTAEAPGGRGESDSQESIIQVEVFPWAGISIGYCF